MASLNKVQIIGNAGRDPEIRYLPSGQAVASISVATTSKRKDKQSGENIESTEWHRVTFFDKLAEIVGEYVKKGSPLYVESTRMTYPSPSTTCPYASGSVITNPAPTKSAVSTRLTLVVTGRWTVVMRAMFIPLFGLLRTRSAKAKCPDGYSNKSAKSKSISLQIFANGLKA